MINKKCILLIATCIILTLTSFETRKQRKDKPFLEEFFSDRYQRYLKTNRCKMDIKYSKRYNSFFWNRIQVPNEIETDMFVMAGCKVNGVKKERCHFTDLKRDTLDRPMAYFKVDVRKLSEKLIQYSIFQDIKGLLHTNLHNFTTSAGFDITLIRRIYTDTIIEQLAYNCLLYYFEKKLLGNVLTKKQRKIMTIDYCLNVKPRSRQHA